MKHLRLLGAVAAAAALAVPASASAHGSVWTSKGRVVVPNTNPVQVTEEARFVITNHGFTIALRESNGATAKGMIDYKMLPSAYRRQLSPEQLLAEGDTGAQPHATCRGVAALEAVDAIRAWQDTDPFYNYVPFQADAAGLEDTPARWLAVVRARTGADLTRESAQAACARLGGTYTPADAIATTAASLASGTVEEATAPLTAQIDSLKAAAAQAKAAADAQIAQLSLALTPLRVTLPAARASARRGLAVRVTGPPLKTVALRLSVSASQARKLKLRSPVVATGTARLAADGTGQVTLKPGKAARARLKRSVGVTVEAVSGSTTTRATLTR